MNQPNSAVGSDSSVQITLAAKEKLEQEYRAILFDDMLHCRTEFAAGPYEAHVQFSNFCNMSCIMCWDGNNPPTKKTPPDLLEKIGDQIGKHLSIVTPYSGSEPLVLTWDQTRDMANKYGILLCITTNVQFLNEAMFHDLKDITETLILSIDSHIPAVFEKIRPRSNSRKVFANLETTARLCVEHNLECIVNVVFMTQNAPMMTDTLNYLADLGIQNVNMIQLLDVNATSRMHDPLIHFSEEYVAWIKRGCIATAKERKFRLIWSIGGYTEYDFRKPGYVEMKSRKLWNDQWDLRMKRLFPGFCRNAYGRLRIESEGDVAPCCYATRGELSLGNLNEQDFEEIWNGLDAQDLRRGMYTGDVPALCKSCRYHDIIPSEFTMPFVEAEESGWDGSNHPIEAMPGLKVLGPDHAQRSTEPVTIQFSAPEVAIKEFRVALSLGGETDEVHRHIFNPESVTDGQSFRLPDEVWNQLRPNVGYWWMVWAVPAESNETVYRLEEVRCLIRHQEMARMEGSKLKYLDQGFVPVSDLGGSKKQGWDDPEKLQQRPKVSATGHQEFQTLQTPVSSPPVVRTHKTILSRLFGDASQVEKQATFENGYLEVVVQEKEALRLGGWILFSDGPADSIEFVSTNGISEPATVSPRADIGKAYPGIELAVNAGFKALLPDDQFWENDGYQFSLIAKRNQAEFRCQFTCRGGSTIERTDAPFNIGGGVLNI